MNRLASMLQYSNDQIMIFFRNDLLQIHKLRLFSRIKLFEVSTCVTCRSLVNMIQYIKLVWKRRINIIFHKDQTNLQKQIKLKVDVENDSYFCKKLSGADLNCSKQIRNPWRKMRCSYLVKFEGFSFQLYYQPNSFTGIVLVFFVLLF